MKQLTKKQFKRLLLLPLGLGLLGMAADTLCDHVLPPALHEYKTLQFESELTTTDYVGFVCTIPIIAAFEGLRRFRPYSRPLTLSGLALILILTPFEDVYVHTPLASMFYASAVLVLGVVIGLIYFSPVAEWFNQDSSDSDTSKPVASSNQAETESR